MREEFGFADWLESIGPVKWIVLGRNAEPNTESCRKNVGFLSTLSNATRSPRDWSLPLAGHILMTNGSSVLAREG